MKLPNGFRMDARSAWLVLVACLSVSMVVAAMAALNTALPDIAVDTGADAGQMTWIVDGYTLALAALLLPAGAIGDRFGRREVLIVGLVFFGIASLAAIWVNGPEQLILTRCLAGAAAALIMPTTLSLITSGMPDGQRAVGISIWSAIAGGGAIAGFLVTGLLLEFFSWHSIFITFAASSAVSALLCFTIGTSKDTDPGRFDIPGTLCSVLAIAGVVFGLLEAPHRGWDDLLVLGCLIGGILLAVLFVVVELRSASPLFDVRLLRNRAFGSGSLSVAVQFLASFGMFYLVLQLLQLVFGYSPLQSAVALMPFVAGVGVFSLLSNWLAVRLDSLKFVIAGGALLSGIGLTLLGLIRVDDYWTLAWILAVIAIGIGLASAPATTAIMSNTPLDNQGVGSAINDTAREIGAAIGIAIAGSMVAAGYKARIGETADLAREQLTAAGQQQIAAGDPTGGQATIAQAEQAGTLIERSLAEARVVVDNLSAQSGELADKIAQGSQAAFDVPFEQASLILGGIMLASTVVLLWITPRRVVEGPVITSRTGDLEADPDLDDTYAND
ncbi:MULTISPECIES: MFS transporter [Gordonia]|uniref:MFS transporter n=1 Tax=Gordonia alkanivorans CGMCC 6845 TaxID=1423140 RepID=W9DHU2_9ACTN|nr:MULTISPECIES: MFS transporter [Gordonia]ETA05815.1 MFS transporter [Gordonia alkanivorans CGMCC 6845]MDH3005829.1 MFS transporter [Gordonia alkanivorans]MDH3011201.1 MFS transporter [Gordonia alkanivorans]MDH3016122.1 MFS transporter [Gordonia alkanivorans]MDH3019760.1 MFS transporter [Gordonia alkanivorans]